MEILMLLTALSTALSTAACVGAWALYVFCKRSEENCRQYDVILRNNFQLLRGCIEEQEALAKRFQRLQGQFHRERQVDLPPEVLSEPEDDLTRRDRLRKELLPAKIGFVPKPKE